MCAGGVLAYLVLIPLIKFFGEACPRRSRPARSPIREMAPGADPQRLRALHRRGRGGGGRHHQLFRSLPIIWHGLREGLRDVGGRARAA